MAKTDWAKVAADFAAANSKTGISAKDWCEKLGINYQSARRYLKSRGQSPDKPDTFQAAAEIAQKKLRKTTKNCAIAQTATNAQKRKTGKALRKPAHEPEPADSDAANTNSGRDATGRFADGNDCSVGNAGNLEPVTRWQSGVQLTKTHGGYARFCDDQEPFQAAEEIRLMDELRLCRARVISVTKALNNIALLIDAAESVEDKAGLYNQMLKAEQALERNIGRIESI